MHATARLEAIIAPEHVFAFKELSELLLLEDFFADFHNYIVALLLGQVALPRVEELIDIFRRQIICQAPSFFNLLRGLADGGCSTKALRNRVNSPFKTAVESTNCHTLTFQIFINDCLRAKLAQILNKLFGVLGFWGFGVLGG